MALVYDVVYVQVNLSTCSDSSANCKRESGEARLYTSQQGGYYTKILASCIIKIFQSNFARSIANCIKRIGKQSDELCKHVRTQIGNNACVATTKTKVASYLSTNRESGYEASLIPDNILCSIFYTLKYMLYIYICSNFYALTKYLVSN